MGLRMFSKMSWGLAQGLFRNLVRGLAAVAVGGALALPGLASAEALKVGYVEFPPYTYTDGGAAKGSLIELLDVVTKGAGLTFTAESAPARRLFAGIPEGEFHLFLGVKTPEAFQGTTLASAQPIGTIELYAWGMGQAPAVKAKEDLSGKSVIVLTGYSYGGWRTWMDDPANKVAVVEARTPDQALKLLEAGRAPILLQYRLPMEQALAGQTVAGLTSSLVSALDIYFVLSKKTPDADAVMAKLEASFAEAKAAGKIK